MPRTGLDWASGEGAFGEAAAFPLVPPQPVAVLPSQPLVRLHETLRAHVVGSSLARCGLTGTVSWRPEASSSSARAIKFNLQVGGGHRVWQQLRTGVGATTLMRADASEALIGREASCAERATEVGGGLGTSLEAGVQSDLS